MRFPFFKPKASDEEISSAIKSHQWLMMCARGIWRSDPGFGGGQIPFDMWWEASKKNWMKELPRASEEKIKSLLLEAIK